VRILVPTVYPTVGGSTRVLLAAASALAVDHDVVVRGPIVEADEETQLMFSNRSFDKALAWLGATLQLARLTGAEIASLRGRAFDVIYVHDNPSLYVYGIVARTLGARVVLHVHLEGSSLLEIVRKNIAHHAIHISNHSAAASRRSVIIRNPVAPISVGRRPLSNEWVIAGSISRRKNQLFAVDVLAALLRSGLSGRLRLCGDVVDVGYVRQIRQRAAAIGEEERLVFDGFVEPRNYLASASCLLMPSLLENQPLAALEAVAAEVPVVASDIPAHRELVDLGCLPAAAVVPLIPETFAEAVVCAQKMPDMAVYAARVREIFSANKFSAELAAFFRIIERRHFAESQSSSVGAA